MTRLEEAAKAIYDNIQWGGLCVGSWDFVPMGLKEHYLLMADAVIKALREPSQRQYDALCQVDVWRNLNSEIVWKTYIDAVLSELDQARKDMAASRAKLDITVMEPIFIKPDDKVK